MKKSIIYIALFAALFAACTPEKSGEKPADVELFPVSIKATLPSKDMAWNSSDAIAVSATCSRSDKALVSLSSNPVARLSAAAEGVSVNFLAATDADKLQSADGDRSFKFYAAYPFPEGAQDLKAVPLNASPVQKYSADPKANLPMVCSTSALNVMGTVELPMASPYCIIKFILPNNIIAGQSSILKKLSLSSENVKLSETGSYNVLTETFTSEATSTSVCVDCGNGLALEQDTTPVCMVTKPFTVPAGGLKLTVETSEKTVTIDVMTTMEGASVDAGTITELIVSSKGDSVNPVTFPVVFPLGLDDANVPLFKSSGANNNYVDAWKNTEASGKKWICRDQPSAYATWNWGPRFEGETIKPYIEIVNSKSISSPGMKGVWTGDYMEFNIPVKNFAAGTTLNITFPFYGRQHPIFWDIEYLDGTEWKCNRQMCESQFPAKDETGAHADMEGKTIKCEATFACPVGGTVISKDITFTKSLEDGYIKIRLTCVHGEYQNCGGSEATTGPDYIRKIPWKSSDTTYGAPIYFYCADAPKQHLVISYK